MDIKQMQYNFRNFNNYYLDLSKDSECAFGFATNINKDYVPSSKRMSCDHSEIYIAAFVTSNDKLMVRAYCNKCHNYSDQLNKLAVLKLINYGHKILERDEDMFSTIEERIDKIRNMSNSEIYKIAYGMYLKTKKWFDKRDERLKMDNYICQVCKINKAFTAHHINYPDIDDYGTEPMEYLISICKECHEIKHKDKK